MTVVDQLVQRTAAGALEQRRQRQRREERHCERRPRGGPTHPARYVAIGTPDGAGIDVCSRHLSGAVAELLAAGAQYVTVSPIEGAS